MNIILYSCNEDVLTRWKEIISSKYTSVTAYNNSSELDEHLLGQVEKHILLYHLSDSEGEEQWLKNLQQLHHKYLSIIALSNTPIPVKGIRLLALGIKGFANTYSAKEKLIMAIDVVNKGEIWLGEVLIKYILDYLKKDISIEGQEEESNELSHQTIFQKLTSREQQIAQKVLLGKQNKLIAYELNITERTVKAHLGAIYHKAEVRNRLELSLILQKQNRRSGKKRIDRRQLM